MERNTSALRVLIASTRLPFIRYYFLECPGLVTGPEYIILAHEGFTGVHLVADTLHDLPHVTEAFLARPLDRPYCFGVAVDEKVAWGWVEPRVLETFRRLLNFKLVVASEAEYVAS